VTIRLALAFGVVLAASGCVATPIPIPAADNGNPSSVGKEGEQGQKGDLGIRPPPLDDAATSADRFYNGNHCPDGGCGEGPDGGTKSGDGLLDGRLDTVGEGKGEGRIGDSAPKPETSTPDLTKGDGA